MVEMDSWGVPRCEPGEKIMYVLMRATIEVKSPRVQIAFLKLLM